MMRAATNLYLLLASIPPRSGTNTASEMRAAVRAPRQRRAALRVVGLWLRAIGDVLVNAAAAHVDILRQDLSYTGRVLRRAPGLRGHGRRSSSRSASARRPRRSRSPTSSCSGRCRFPSPIGW